MSCQDAIADFLSFMETQGVVPIEPIASRLASGSLIRFRCEGDGKGRQNGWAILYLDERPAGAFGNYRLNTGTLKWKSGAERPALSQAERDALQREWREAREKREAERISCERQAALDAGDLWRRAGAASPEHGYVARKRIDPYPLRQIGPTLLIPMFDQDGLLWNLQRVAPDGEKRFLRGAKVDDLFTFVGKFSPETTEVVFAEGYATADAIHQSTGHPAIVAFTAKNMIRVARIWAKRRPDLELIVFADDDAGTAAKPGPHFGKNPGRESAEAAALEVGARLATLTRGVA